jgi:hypothetical protein
MGCDAALGPYMIRGFLLNPVSARFPKDSPQWAALAAAFLDEAHCPAARALVGADRLFLQVILQVIRPIAKLRRVLAQATTCFNAAYSAPEADPIRAHIFLGITEATPEQLADRSFATDREIAAIKAVFPRIHECEQNILAQLSTVSPSLVSIVSASYGKVAEHGTLLTDRKITWGEYNTDRRATAMDLQSQMMAELQRSSQGPH